MNQKPQGNASLFDATPEKGSREWKSVGDVLKDGQIGAYRVVTPRIVHLPVHRGAPHHQQFFILKNTSS